MSKADIKSTYEHYYKPAKEIPYPEGYKLVLVNTPEKFEKFLALIESHSIVAMDTETTSLDMSELELVGTGVSFEEKRSFYLPWRHKVDPEDNLPIELLKVLYEKVIKTKKVLWYNYSFDGPVLEREGFDIEGLDYYDVMTLVWLTDTNKKLPSLDWAADHFLGWKGLMKFKELIAGLANFSFLSPKDALMYAATDPLAVYNLYNLLYEPISKECPFIVKLDNKLVLPLIRGQAEDHLISGDELRKVEVEVEEHLPRLRDEIYKESGQVFDIGSPAQVADVLERLGLDTGGRTKKGKLLTRAENLEKLDHPVAMKIVEYKQLSAIKNSFINPLMQYADRAKPCRFKYFAMTAPCLTEGSIVLTDQGYHSIKDCESSKLVWTKDGWKRQLGWREVGLEKTLRVRTNFRVEIEGTYHHPVLVKDRKGTEEFKRLDELGVGDRIRVNTHHPRGFTKVGIEFKGYETRGENKGLKIPSELSPELSRLIGFIAGDGSIVEDGVKLCFWEGDKDLIKTYTELFERVFEKKTNFGKPGKDHTVGIKYCSIVLRDFFRELQAKEDKVPDIIKRGGPDAFYNYVAGYFDADGSSAGNCWRIKSKSRNRMIEMQNLLNISGFQVSSGEGNSNQKVIWMYHPKNIEEFQEIVRPFSTRKGQQRQDRKRPRKRRDFCRVLSIEKSTGVVYDIEVEDVHHFIANGMVTHNTGRLSAGKDEKNPYFAGLNIQAIAKPHMVKKYAHYVGGNEGIMGWVFNDDPSDRMVEIPDINRNVRRAFKAPEGYWFVRADYSGEELRIVANLSREPAWVEAFSKGEDIHGKVCKEVFGELNAELRKQTKVVNFGIIYGSTAYSFAKKFNKSEDEGKKFYADYKNKHRRLFGWIEAEKRLARRSGIVYTKFGRPRRLFYYYSSTDQKVRGFADRSAVNSIVQGSGADVFRIGMVNLYNKMYKVHDRDFIFQMGVHDELDSLVRKGKEHLIDEMVDILTVNLKGWDIPLVVSVDIGTSWGDLVTFQKEEGVWKPQPC